jgi:hypothetical protein
MVDMVLKALPLGLTYGGARGIPGESVAAEVITGNGEIPRPLKLGLRFPPH